MKHKTTYFLANSVFKWKFKPKKSPDVMPGLFD